MNSKTPLLTLFLSLFSFDGFLIIILSGDFLIWAGKEILRWISNVDDDQIQPNGIDLTVGRIYKFKGPGLLTRQEREIPEYQELESDYWHLKPGAYIVRYNEFIRIPKNAVGIVLPRSSLLRMGATIYSALWDSGYEGRGIGLLEVFNSHGIRIERNARIAQIIFVSARSSGTYEGVWKGEK